MIMQLYTHMRMCVYMYLNLNNSRQLECVQLVCARVRREGRRVGIPANRRAVHAFTVCAGRLSMQWHGATWGRLRKRKIKHVKPVAAVATA